MFEGKHPLPGMSIPLQDGREADDLRPLRWDELVARLSAARDLHVTPLPCDQSAEGSFDAGSARKIAAHHNGKPGVNLEVSMNIKGAKGKFGGAVHDAGHRASIGAVRNK